MPPCLSSKLKILGFVSKAIEEFAEDLLRVSVLALLCIGKKNVTSFKCVFYEASCNIDISLQTGHQSNIFLFVSIFFSDYVYFENSSSNPYLIRRIEELNKVGHLYFFFEPRSFP